jgi:hypothetical protein
VYKQWIHLDTDDDAIARDITIGQQARVRNNLPAQDDSDTESTEADWIECTGRNDD